MMEPSITCIRCGRTFYNHEVVDVDVGKKCVACVCEELLCKLRDLQERLEALEDIILKKVEV